jgi:predicted enzyme related to lactoylglutathione lyase
MSGPARAGAIIYAKDLARLAGFYAELLQMQQRYASAEYVVLQSADMQLVVHAMPPQIARTIEIQSPPDPREQTAVKLFFTVPGLPAAREAAARLGGLVYEQLWPGRGFRACNAMDPEGNIFQVREFTTPSPES